MKEALKNLLKPEYVYQPQRLLQRLVGAGRGSSSSGGQTKVRLPWGHEMTVNLSDDVGKTLERLGVFELPVVEALFRTVGAGDMCLDVGANIGAMTLAMAQRVGPGGKVVAFEPHPVIFSELQNNIKANSLGQVELRQLGCSSAAGTAQLEIPADFATNRGVAAIASGDSTGEVIEIQIDSLDNAFPSEKIKVMKLDVEGHEISVLAGAKKLITERRLQHLVFEDHDVRHSEVIGFLKDHGYTIFRLERGRLGPVLLENLETQLTNWEPPNFIATLDAGELKKAYQRRGWLTFGG